uniref:Uncharacterized protein n=1 Tax=Arundo donax TaxID=35708 RepID=A0A0A9SQX5_ARUDO
MDGSMDAASWWTTCRSGTSGTWRARGSRSPRTSRCSSTPACGTPTTRPRRSGRVKTD